jgi:hypothetical protein
MAAVDVVDAYVSALPGGGRRLAHAEWGITVPAESVGGDEALDVGLRIADGILRAQAVALHGAGDLDAWMLLWWNRQTRFVRYGCTRSRDIWVHADLPLCRVSPPGSPFEGTLEEPGVDRLLGLVTEAAVAVRDYAARARA